VRSTKNKWSYMCEFILHTDLPTYSVGLSITNHNNQKVRNSSSRTWLRKEVIRFHWQSGFLSGFSIFMILYGLPLENRFVVFARWKARSQQQFVSSDSFYICLVHYKNLS